MAIKDNWSRRNKMHRLQKTHDGYHAGSISTGSSLRYVMGTIGFILFLFGFFLIWKSLVSIEQGARLFAAASVLPFALGGIFAYAAIKNPSHEMIIDLKKRKISLLFFSNGKLKKTDRIELKDIKSVFTEFSGDVDAGTSRESSESEAVVLKLHSGSEKRFMTSCPLSGELRDLILGEIGKPPAPVVTGISGFGKRVKWETQARFGG